MIIAGDGHFFETEEMFEKCMEPSLRNYRPRLLKDDQGYNFWVVDGQTPYKRPSIKGAGAPLLFFGGRAGAANRQEAADLLARAAEAPLATNEPVSKGIEEQRNLSHAVMESPFSM